MIRHYIYLLLIETAFVAYAEDPRDAEIFGESVSSEAAGSDNSPVSKPDSLSVQESKLIENLQIGGRLELRTSFARREDETVAKSAVSQLRQADLYFDSRPLPNLRTFLRARWREQTGAGLTGGTAGTVPIATPETPTPGNGPGGRGSATASTSNNGVRQDIDELWVKWDQDDRVFWTVGKQHLKWGSARFWNPTDFTAVEVRDPIEVFDRRLGQNLIKLHVPSEKQAFNFYAVGQFDEAEQLDGVRGGLRAEIAFFGQGELAVTAYGKPGGAHRLGLDVSSALGPFDVYVEGAQMRHEMQTTYEGEIDESGQQLPTAKEQRAEVLSQVVGGIARQWQYNSTDSLTIGIESFYNELGYSDRKLQLYAMLRGGARPLYAARRYAAMYLLLPTPFSLNNTTLRLSSLKNGTDGTRLTNITATWSLFKQANVEVFANRCDGDYGEFCLRVPEVYRSLAPNLPVSRTLLSVGAGISTAF